MSQVYFGSDLISSLESKDFGFKDTTNKVKSTNVQDAIVEVAGKACNEVELTQAEYEELEKNGGVLADVNYYITDGEAGGGSGDGCKKIECTLAEYEEWEAAGTIDPTTLYFITDGDAGLNARTIVYNNTESGMTSGNVQDAIDELNANMNDVNIEHSELLNLYNNLATKVDAWGSIELNGYKGTLTGTVSFDGISGQNSATRDIYFGKTFMAIPAVSAKATTSISQAQGSLQITIANITKTGCKITIKNTQAGNGYNAANVSCTWTATL